jgi:outer membrane lipoprotein-sorting protein
MSGPLSMLLALTAAQTDPAQVMKDMDAAMNAYADLALTYEMIDKQPGRDDRKMSFDISIKGDKRFTEFTSPADMKGTKVLIVSQTQMYIYLPSYKKVRRIASHVTNQGFMGTAYSNDDMALSRFGDKYDAKLLGEDAATWSLEVTKKNDEAPYDKIKIVVDKKTHQPIKLEYFSEEGKHIKTETRTKFECHGKVCSPEVLEMTDLRTNGHSSKLIRRAWKVNPGLNDRVFSKRNLQQ